MVSELRWPADAYRSRGLPYRAAGHIASAFGSAVVTQALVAWTVERFVICFIAASCARLRAGATLSAGGQAV